ncbi:protein arginine kinase [Paenibacillus sp. GYB006]|uniref:protein arginine kinase n=1 Tax=Paenibacillus sp. GYB006 TaxID=2994394 RepID=UPI002F96BDF9
MSDIRFTDKPLSEWMRSSAADSEIVISSRVRVARNVQSFPFPMLATDQQSRAVLDKVTEVLQFDDIHQFGSFHVLNLNELSDLDQEILVEKHLISPNLANESRNGAVILSEDESISIMVNEEDHLRIQCLYPGFQVQEAWKRASAIDDVFEAHIDYSFDDRRGYLTSCPTNVGTGVRASVMMHLPALVMTKQIGRVLTAVSQVGLAVRGIYGEGSEATGNLFQISNQITLGQTEAEIIDNLYSVVLQIIGHERNARERLMTDSKLRIADRVMRSYGILSHAYLMDSKEAAQRISDVRLGIDLDLIREKSIVEMNELNVLIQPGFLQKKFGRTLESGERDMYRAQLIRESFQRENQ